jgi:uncharacterized protein Smg (DUF494 family)
MEALATYDRKLIANLFLQKKDELSILQRHLVLTRVVSLDYGEVTKFIIFETYCY